ncbi:MAG: hypothetical protein ABFE07_26015 [Armatimonadia bacterium]
MDRTIARHPHPSTAQIHDIRFLGGIGGPGDTVGGIGAMGGGPIGGSPGGTFGGTAGGMAGGG